MGFSEDCCVNVDPPQDPLFPHPRPRPRPLLTQRSMLPSLSSALLMNLPIDCITPLTQTSIGGVLRGLLCKRSSSPRLPVSPRPLLTPRSMLPSLSSALLMNLPIDCITPLTQTSIGGVLRGLLCKRSSSPDPLFPSTPPSDSVQYVTFSLKCSSNEPPNQLYHAANADIHWWGSQRIVV